MKNINYKDLKISVYTDPNDWIQDFYEIPEGVEYEIEANKLPQSAGFAQIDDKQIYIFKKQDCEFIDMLETVSHEYGHIIEGGFTHNPPQEDEYDLLHEQKADFYQNFVLDCYQITQMVLRLK